ncbi:hypothetical protein A0H81_11864 [Grifola frondosa]|uniref:DUF1746 domain-containing protein n=1 Tax=Grifola frondosa TaxID=5627 RepID=A0A1C7LUE8_GRIFR|nr:hypothetical protein A0H81_11864 [Grifola frondosa]
MTCPCAMPSENISYTHSTPSSTNFTPSPSALTTTRHVSYALPAVLVHPCIVVQLRRCVVACDRGAAEGRSVILDFVGIAHVPSKLHLLLLDFLIIFLEMVLTTIAYETSLSSEMPPDTPDPLLPIPPNSAPDSTERSKSSQSLSYERPYVIDLHFSTILEHLRHPHLSLRETRLRPSYASACEGTNARARSSSCSGP